MKLTSCLFLMLLIYGCTREEVTPRLYPRVKSINTSNVNVNGFSATGEITFSSADTVLETGKVYYIRPFARSSEYVVYGDQMSFEVPN